LAAKKSSDPVRPKEKTLIGVIAGRDEKKCHEDLVSLLDEFCDRAENLGILSQYAFVFTKGTFFRILLGKDTKWSPVKPTTLDRLIENCGVIRLPAFDEGGIVLLSYLVVQRQLNILWPFLTPNTFHWMLPDNMALMRLADQWHIKRLLNAG
jgi:hypothetical protein